MPTVWATKTSRLLWQVVGRSQLLFIRFCMNLSHKQAFVSQVFICSLWCIPLPQEVGISELPASFVIRNTPPKSEFQVGTSEEPQEQRGRNSIWLLPLSTLGENFNLHSLLTTWSVFSITEKSNWQYCAMSTVTNVVFVLSRAKYRQLQCSCMRHHS